MSVFDTVLFYTVNMNIERTVELIEKMNNEREILAHGMVGLGEYNNRLCKIFLGKENLTIYSLEPGLRLLYEFSNYDIQDITLNPMEETTVISNTKLTVGRGILGFIIGDWVGCVLGMLTTVIPEYKTKDVYNLSIVTENKMLCFQIKE